MQKVATVIGVEDDGLEAPKSIVRKIIDDLDAQLQGRAQTTGAVGEINKRRAVG